MKTMVLVLVAVALSAGAALAQYGTVGSCPTCQNTPCPTAVCPAPCPTQCPTACPPPCPVVVPAAPLESAAVFPAGMVGAPLAPAALPGLCAAVAAQNLTRDEVIFVLGYEEDYALYNLPGRAVDSSTYSLWTQSPIDQENALLSYEPNTVVKRHGNPYYPYAQVTSPGCVSVACTIERMIGLNCPLNPCDRQLLTEIGTRYQTLTPQAALCSGYQPACICVEGMGNIYINQALVDNTFDPMQPEAFTFDNCGRLLAAHYIVCSEQPVVQFGQNFVASPLLPGTQQLAVWLFRNNPNGLFCLQAPRILCAGSVERCFVGCGPNTSCRPCKPSCPAPCPTACPAPCPTVCPAPCPAPCPNGPMIDNTLDCPTQVCPTCPTAPPCL